MAPSKSASPVAQRATLFGFFGKASQNSSKSQGAKGKAKESKRPAKRKRAPTGSTAVKAELLSDDSDVEIISHLLPERGALPPNQPSHAVEPSSSKKRTRAQSRDGHVTTIDVASSSQASAMQVEKPVEATVQPDGRPSPPARVRSCSRLYIPSSSPVESRDEAPDPQVQVAPEAEPDDNAGEEVMSVHDDEGDGQSARGDDSDFEILEGSSKDLEESERQCPICGAEFTDVNEETFETHVSQCVEEQAAATKSEPMQRAASDEKARRPLSFLPSFSLPRRKPTKQEEEDAKPTGPPNAFTALMAGHAENKAWKVAQESDRMKGRLPQGEKRPVPFYKWIEGMQITVDAFKYGKIEGCKGYFLSHAHSDHYQLLNSSWSHGPIYCSRTTANLIKLKLNVRDEYLKALPMDQTVDIDGIKVTLIDANHCPGSVLFLFEGPHTDPKSHWSKRPDRIFRYLHCGDFRASPMHINHPALRDKHIEKCYLDTTYLNPKYCFPAQELVIEACASLVKSHVVDGDESALYRVGGEEQAKQSQLMKGWLDSAKLEVVEAALDADAVKPDISAGPTKKRERLLVVVGTYSIGKERIVKAIAQALNTKIWGDDYKMALFKAQDDPVLQSMLTTDPLEAAVHVTNLHAINHDGLLNHLNRFRTGENGFTRLIGLRPTGWTFKSDTLIDKMPSFAKIFERERMRKFSPAGMYPQRDSTPLCLAFGVPYSEHSSFFELTCFALSLDYNKMIPTVNVGSELSRKKMNDWFTRWQSEKKKRRESGLPSVIEHRHSNFW